MGDLKEATEHVDAEEELYWGGKEAPDGWLKLRTEGETTVNSEAHPERVRFIHTITYKRLGDEVEKTQVNYTVPVDYTEPNYGGVRPLFICPECARRRRKLYLPPRRGASRYLCRERYDLGYRSSKTSGEALKQAELRYRRAFAKADVKNRRPRPNNAPYTSDRPKGMHQDTFEHLVEEVESARREWDRQQTQEMREMLRDLNDAHDALPGGR